MNPYLIPNDARVAKYAPRAGKYCQYRTIKRLPIYIYRLVERAFCLDVNVLSRDGFFRSGRGVKWDYECRNMKLGYLGMAHLTLIDSETERGEHDILFDSPDYYIKQTIKIRHERNSFIRQRYWLSCLKCRRRVTKLFILQGEQKLECRLCNKVYYLSQMRGRKRLGEEAYKNQQESYKVHKTLVRDVGENTEDKRS